MAERRLSARKRLEALPAVFRVQELPRLTGWSSASAAVAVHRWAKEGMVRRTGPRGGVIVNHYAEEARHVAHERVAIARAWPGAIEIGGGPIHASGWTTQIPRLVDIAVPGKSYREPAAGGVLRHHRPPAWYEAVQRGLDSEGGSLSSLSPEWALADAVLDASLWAPYPDELYADEASKRSKREFRRAFEAIAAARRFPLESLEAVDRAADMEDLYEHAWSISRERKQTKKPVAKSPAPGCGA